MAKNILKKILTVIGYHAPDIARIITIVMCIIMTGHWIAVNKDGMNVFIVLFSVLVIYPLLGLVLSVLIIIPSFIYLPNDFVCIRKRCKCRRPLFIYT